MRILISLLLAASINVNANAFDTEAKQAIILDDATQSILLNKAADEKMFPSSMSKLMTLYILFEKLKSGAITLDSTFPVSEKAWKKGGSKMFVKVNTQVRVEDLILGIIVQSGNDACIVVAEALAGSEAAFAEKMTTKAEEIGLRNSHFTNSTGWPDEQHFMTAHDIALLSYRLVRDFPQYYPYFKRSEFTYSGITQPNRNRLISKNVGVDGLKTGHTEIAGYGIAVSGMQPEGGRRVHVVVNGLDSDAARIAEAHRLLEYGYREFEQKQLKNAAEPIALLPVWFGAQESVSVGVAEPLSIPIPHDDSNMRFVMNAIAPISAPIKEGQTIAVLEIYNGEQRMKTTPLIAQKAVPAAGFMQSIFKKIILLLKG